MIFSKKDHLVGLDIGSSFIKVAELQISKKQVALKRYGMARIAPGAISEGRIMDMEGVAAVIRDLFKAQKIKEKNVAISTGGHSVVIKTINTTKVSDKELHKTIVSESEQYIPYDIEDVNIDYQILGESEFSPDQMNVLLVAVRKDLVAEYIDLITMAGLVPKIIDVDTFALQNLYETLPDQNPEEVILLVDVGASKTSLNILKNNASVMMRDATAGTGQLIEEVAQQFGVSEEDAQRLVEDRNAGPEDLEKLDGICREIAGAWCAEICEVVYTFQSNTNEEGIDKILLSGGGSYVRDLSENLRSELDTRVEALQPFSGLSVNEKKFPADFLSKAGLQAPIALGLALRRIDDK